MQLIWSLVAVAHVQVRADRPTRELTNDAVQ